MSHGPIAILKGLPISVRILVAGTFVNKAGSFIVPFLTLVLRREFGLSGEAVGALMGAYGVGSVTSILAGGALTDRWGRRATLLASLLGSGLLADRSWRLLFVADGATTLAFGLLVAMLIAESRPSGSEGSVARARPSTASPWRDAVFVQMAAASLVFSSLFLALLTVLPLTVTLSAGYPARA